METPERRQDVIRNSEEHERFLDEMGALYDDFLVTSERLLRQTTPRPSAKDIVGNETAMRRSVDSIIMFALRARGVTRAEWDKYYFGRRTVSPKNT